MEISNVERPFIPFNFEVLLCDKKGSRRFYNIFISSKKVVRKYLDKWENKMQINFNLCKWSLVFKVPFTCTVDTKLRWFQFRLIHRILGTNSFLFKINKVDSNVCVFCKEEEETLIHLFCSCIYSINFWTSLVYWVKDKIDISLYLDNKVILFGNANNSLKCLNLILLLSRFHIYKMKMNEKLPSFSLFKKDIRKYYILEKYMSVVNGEVQKFRSKWEQYLVLCQE